MSASLQIGLFVGGLFLGTFWFSHVILPLCYGFPRSFLWAARGWVIWNAPLRYLVSAIIWPFAFLGFYLVLDAFLPRPAAFILQSKFFWAGQVGGFLFTTTVLFRQSTRLGIRMSYVDYVRRYLTNAGIFVIDSTMTMKYLRLEILMDVDLQVGRGRAAVRWQPLTPHATLAEDQTRIALAALHYARMLIVHGETTGELFQRIATGAQGLIDGDPVLALDPWQLETQGLSFQLWPWAMEQLEALEGPSMYVATLERTWKGNLGIHLEMPWGQERVLAPSSVLIVLYALARSLDVDGRILLGRTLRVMNEHWIKTGTLKKLGSDEEALEAAMPVLLGDSHPTHADLGPPAPVGEGAQALPAPPGSAFVIVGKRETPTLHVKVGENEARAGVEGEAREMSEMNEKVEEPQEQASEPRPLREVSPEELQKILEAHRKWVESKGKEGKRADLTLANLQGADLSGANLSRATLSGADLTLATLQGATLTRATLSGATLQQADLTLATLQRADLDGATLQRADLDGANLQQADLIQANLKWAALSGANLREATLIAANLQRANLMTANLQGAILGWANLQGAILFGATLDGANLDGANLRDANLQEADLRNARDLIADQVKAAKNWELAFYSKDFLKELGLPPDHNEQFKKKLAELEKEKKATGGK